MKAIEFVSSYLSADAISIAIDRSPNFIRFTGFNRGAENIQTCFS
jgi:hypothetical protein